MVIADLLLRKFFSTLTTRIEDIKLFLKTFFNEYVSFNFNYALLIILHLSHSTLKRACWDIYKNIFIWIRNKYLLNCNACSSRRNWSSETNQSKSVILMNVTHQNIYTVSSPILMQHTAVTYYTRQNIHIHMHSIGNGKIVNFCWKTSFKVSILFGDFDSIKTERNTHGNIRNTPFTPKTYHHAATTTYILSPQKSGNHFESIF